MVTGQYIPHNSVDETRGPLMEAGYANEKEKQKEREREKRSWRLLPRRAVLGWLCGGFDGATATRDEFSQRDEELHVC